MMENDAGVYIDRPLRGCVRNSGPATNGQNGHLIGPAQELG